MNTAAAGDRALLLDLGEVSAGELHAAAAAVRAVRGVRACIIGHSSLYVVFDAGPDPSGIEKALAHPPSTQLSAAQHRITVNFEGPDLPTLLSRIPRNELLDRVAGLRLIVRYLGFRGGFAYLDGWPAEWSMPRRPTSRPVPRGSFAIAGSVAGFYPIDTPGGWNLIGRTNEPLQNRFAPGDEIRIVPTEVTLVEDRQSCLSSPAVLPDIEIISAPLAVVVTAQDWSRVDHGLPPGGPFDDVAAATANLAVGNSPDAPLLECAMVGPRVRATNDVVAAWCDASGDVQTFELKKGQEFAIGRIARGLRGYFAVGRPSPGLRPPSPASGRGLWNVIHAIRGPHDIGLDSVDCEVTPQLDRVGVRLRPLEPIAYAAPADLRSCGMQCGTVQLHPDGSLVVMGPDHPVTGGYLQPMTVLSSERWKVAQLAPGERVRLIAQLP